VDRNGIGWAWKCERGCEACGCEHQKHSGDDGQPPNDVRDLPMSRSDLPFKVEQLVELVDTRVVGASISSRECCEPSSLGSPSSPRGWARRA
jgi:hypothetical protein